MPLADKWADFPLGGPDQRSISRCRLRYSSNAFTMVSSIFFAGVHGEKNFEIRSLGILNSVIKVQTHSLHRWEMGEERFVVLHPLPNSKGK